VPSLALNRVVKLAVCQRSGHYSAVVLPFILLATIGGAPVGGIGCA